MLAMVFFVSTQAVYANPILFEDRETFEPAPGVVYERIFRMTERGMLDIHVLTVPLDDPNIYIGPVASDREFGLRDTTTNLLSDAGAVAGINADFFGMAGRHSVHFGPMVMDGEILGLNTNTNHTYNEFATFFLDEHNNPFFNYLRADVRLYINGYRDFNIAAYNVVGHRLDYPVIISSSLMETTAPLLERFYGLTKFVLRNNTVTQMTTDVITVPTDGYIFVLPYGMYETHGHLINVGDTVRLRIGNSLGLDFSRMQAAIGGGAILLSEGQTVHGRGVAPNARHPRSALGISQDGNTLIMMVVDGRNHSIGATNAEMASLLRNFGAWDAMHLDGGGSSTMVARQPDGRYSVQNTPSDGAQRRVINALGVFDTRPFVPTPIVIDVPPLAELRANPRTVAVFAPGQETRLRFSGVAINGNTVPYVPISAITAFEVVPASLGTIENGVFIAGYGVGHIMASVNGINTYIPVTIGGGPQRVSIHNSRLDTITYPANYVTAAASADGYVLRLDYNFIETNVTQAAHMSLYPPVALPANTMALNLEVYGNNSGHWLRGRVRDGNGRHHNVDFAASVNFSGWHMVTATLPADAPGPFTLDRLYTVLLNSPAAAAFTMRFRQFEAVVAPPPPPNVPQGPVFRDPLWAQRGFPGLPEGRNFAFAPPYGDYIDYGFRTTGGFAVVTMSMYGRTISTYQWSRFIPDIRSTNAANVVILLDDNPRTGFSQAMEFDLFHRAMIQFTNEGRTVFVVSNQGANTGVYIRDGVRYINMAEGRDIHFRTADDSVWWTD